MTKSPIWHPFTQHGAGVPEVHIDRAEGAYLYKKDGQKILDAISSWWVITHGHCHPAIAAAVRDQTEKLEQVIFAGFTHEPAEALAAKLIDITAPNLKHVFFSDSGSTAVEVALKMAVGYFAHTGEKKSKIVALEGAYHGDTFGAMAAGARSVFNKIYEPYLFEVEHLPFPASTPLTPPPAGGQAKPGGSAMLEKFEALLKGGDVAALIVEPLIQGAGGMRIYSPEMLKALADLCRQYGALLIADEVMTGFGRTGSRFACESAGVQPDIVCLSKGLTGGFLPMGVTLATADIYDAFYDKDRAKMFFHSSSFTGNPLACRAALANLEIWDEEPVMARIEAIAASHKGAVKRFAARDDVENVRTIGTIFALDVALPLNPPRQRWGGEHSEPGGSGYLSDVAPFLYQYYLKHGVLLRPLGNTVYSLPPYCVTAEDLETIYDTIEGSLDALRDERRKRAA